MKTVVKKSISASLILGVLVLGGFVVFEPTITSAVTDDVVVNLTVATEIAITSPADVTLAPNMGVTSNSAIGTALWNVKTNDPAGYTLAVKNASTSPALKNSVPANGHFADYTEATPGTPELWSVDANSFQFGYSSFGTDVNTSTYGTGANCGASGTPTGTLKYRHASTTNITAASRATTTSTAGVDTTVCFAAGQNGLYAPAGTYSATITATATAL